MNFDELMRGVTPSLGPFGDSLGPKLVMILGLVWILCLAGAVGFVMKGGLEFAASRGGRRPGDAADGVMDIGIPVFALVILAIIPAIVTAVV